MKIGRSRTLQSQKYIQKKKKKLVFTLFLSSFTVISIIVLLIIIARISFLQINHFDIRGLSSIEKVEIEKTVNKSITGKYLYFIPKSNIIFYPKKEIIDNLRLSFKKIDSLKLSIKNTNQLMINITERIPEVLICDGYNDDENNSQCSLADKTGFIFEQATEATSTQYFRYYTNSLIDSVTFGKLQDLINGVKKIGIKTNGLLVGEDGSYELYIENIDGSMAVVYFDDRTPFENTLSNLNIFWQNAINKKIGLDTIPNFNYINLRFGNNVFYLVK